MELYNWLKALHIISMVAWMAGMFYLPRLYVYHAGAPVGSATSEIFKLMEHRLLRIIINPAMIATWVFGLGLIWVGGGSNWDGVKDWLAHAHWMHAKFSLLILMQLVHAYLARARKAFARDERRTSAKTFRIINELPTVLLIGIVILVVLKPF
jgi:protoporphyrinogen IX oxidase